MNYQARMFAVLLAVCLVLSPADGQMNGQGTLGIQVDVARFRGDDLHSYVEVYYAFPQRSLTYTQNAEGFKGGVELLVVVRSKDSIHFADRFVMPHVTQDTVAGSMNLVSLSGMMLPDGNYTLSVSGKDVNNPSRSDSVVVQIATRVPPASNVVLSDIEFASTIKKGEKDSPFFKNTLEVIPNVDGVFGNGKNCFFYAEAYNLLANNDMSDLTLKTTVLNAIGKEVISRERPRKRTGESTVLVDNIDVSNLKSGTYTLMLAIDDTSRKTLTTSWKKFFVFNDAMGIDSTLLALDPTMAVTAYSTMDETELDKEFRLSRWEASDIEKDQYAKLKGVEPKRRFLADFWSKRPVGAREVYFQRVNAANSAYASMGVEGYRSDRGRVHITYGPPDDVDRHPNEAGTKPYEIWTYNNIQGGVIFVFVQRQNSGDYELMHSTHRSELSDENWRRYARTN